MNKIKIDEKLHKNVLVYYIGCGTVKNLSCVTINSVNLLYVIIDKLNGYIEETNGNKYLTLVPIDENKETLKKSEELWNKIRGLVRSITNNTENYGKKYMKTHLLPMMIFQRKRFSKKMLEFLNMAIAVWPVLHEDNKYYLYVFSDECFIT